MFINFGRFSRRRNPIFPLSAALSYSTATVGKSSKLYTEYAFQPPESLKPQQNPAHPQSTRKKSKPRYRPPSSLDREGLKPINSELPFDFRFSYTESSPYVRPIGLREPKYSPFGPGRLDRVWTGVCAPAVDPKVGSIETEMELEAKRKETREMIQGEPLSIAETEALLVRCQKHRTKRQINLGRDGLTHNMLSEIHNHWKHAVAVRIKCMGVPTVDMKNVCMQLEDKTFGKIIQRQGSVLVLYRGRHYIPKERPVIPLMLWKPQEPVYPRLIKTTIDGLSVEETKLMRKRGLAVPPLTKLAKNGYYGTLVHMVRDAFLTEELVRIDCKGLERSDRRKIGYKLRDLVPCVLVTFDKEQIVVWRGEDYKPVMDEFSLLEKEIKFNDTHDDMNRPVDVNDIVDDLQGPQDFYSGDSEEE